MKIKDVKVGMKVRIVDKPTKINEFPSFAWGMRRYLGKECEVSAILEHGFFKLTIDDEKWIWAARWFNPIDD